MTRFEKETVFPLRFFYMSSNSLYLTLWLPVMTSYMYVLLLGKCTVITCIYMNVYNIVLCEDSVLYVHVCVTCSITIKV